jgi:PKD repeat protein
MRSIGVLALVTGTLLASACSGEGDVGTPPPDNTAPVANFEVPACTLNVPCDFASTSTDDVEVTQWGWDFNGDGIYDASAATASYTYTTAGTFNVSLTVRDAQGLSHTKTSTITIDPPVVPVNTPPTAGFTYTCDAAVCTFTSTSTDVAPGTIATYAWTFGDGATADVMNPLYSYTITVPTDFTVTLTVTDNEGATDAETQTISVSPPPATAEGCTTLDTRVDCVFNIPARSTVKLKLIEINCDLRRQSVTAPAPIGDQVFLNVCSRTAGEELGIFGGPLDELIVFEPGSQLRIRFHQGIIDENHPVLGAPAAHFEGTFPDWTIHFEDGGNPGGAGEPDFMDIVLGVHATVLP